MILGQSAATAACMAIDQDIAVQDVKYAELSDRLLKDGQVLEMERKPSYPRQVIDPKKLDGVVIDDSQAEKTGAWPVSSSISGYVGNGYVHDENKGQGKKSIAFRADKLDAGKYDVRVAYSSNPNRATNVPVTITSKGKEVFSGTINQKKAPSVDKVFVSLGKFDLSGDAVVTLTNEGVDGYVVADAVVLLPVK